MDYDSGSFPGMKSILMKKLNYPLMLLLLFICSAVWANDSSVGEFNGSIEFLKQNDVSMAKERLLIAPDRINVDYVFINHAAQDVTVPVAFPMPAIYKHGMEDHSIGIANFKISVDGKPVKSESRWRVIHNLGGKEEEDVTAKVLQNGWTLPQLRSVFESDESIEEYKEEGKPPLLPEWFDDGYPNIFIQQYFIWQQHFPAGKEVIIHHSYSPSFSTGVPWDLKTIIDTQDTPFPPNVLKAIKKLDADIKNQSGNEAGIYWGNLAYVLTTGANWKDGTIGDFTLRIHKRKENEVMVPEFNYPLKQIDPLTYEFKQQNFKPTEDLSIMFYSDEFL